MIIGYAGYIDRPLSVCIARVKNTISVTLMPIQQNKCFTREKWLGEHDFYASGSTWDQAVILVREFLLNNPDF